MPADFLTRSLAFLHRTTLDAYEGEESVWWPETRGADTFPVRVPVAAGIGRAQAANVTGLIDLGSDLRQLHLAIEDLPFVPRAQDCFLIGPASGDGPDTAACRLWTVQEAHAFGPLVRITAALQG